MVYNNKTATYHIYSMWGHASDIVLSDLSYMHLSNDTHRTEGCKNHGAYLGRKPNHIHQAQIHFLIPIRFLTLQVEWMFLKWTSFQSK
jgi:hypothetical protein